MASSLSKIILCCLIAMVQNTMFCKLHGDTCVQNAMFWRAIRCIICFWPFSVALFNYLMAMSWDASAGIHVNKKTGIY